MDVSQPGLGLAVLDDGRIGRSCTEGVLALTLLRSPCMPDPESDRGEHAFRYALMPHAGDWRAAHVPREADEVADPVVVLPIPAARGGEDGSGPRAPFRLELSSGDLEIACFKLAEDGNGRILRLVERHGGIASGRIEWPSAVPDVRAVNLLEEPAEADVAHPGGSAITTFSLRPFEILTLAVGS